LAVGADALSSNYAGAWASSSRTSSGLRWSWWIHQEDPHQDRSSERDWKRVFRARRHV